MTRGTLQTALFNPPARRFLFSTLDHAQRAMFYSTQILAKKGPLGTVWIAAHLDRRLKRVQVFETNITDSVGACSSFFQAECAETDVPGAALPRAMPGVLARPCPRPA